MKTELEIVQTVVMMVTGLLQQNLLIAVFTNIRKVGDIGLVQNGPMVETALVYVVPLIWMLKLQSHLWGLLKPWQNHHALFLVPFPQETLLHPSRKRRSQRNENVLFCSVPQSNELKQFKVLSVIGSSSK